MEIVGTEKTPATAPKIARARPLVEMVLVAPSPRKILVLAQAIAPVLVVAMVSAVVTQARTGVRAARIVAREVVEMDCVAPRVEKTSATVTPIVVVVFVTWCKTYAINVVWIN